MLSRNEIGITSSVFNNILRRKINLLFRNILHLHRYKTNAKKENVYHPKDIPVSSISELLWKYHFFPSLPYRGRDKDCSLAFS